MDFFEKLQINLNKGSIITINSKESSIKSMKKDGIIAQHTYALLDYNENTKQFMLFNPYANGQYGGKRIIYQTLEQIKSNFKSWQCTE